MKTSLRPMIAIVDYGMGNLRSVQKAFESLGAEARITDEARVIERAEKVVLPGVGAFGKGMEELKARGLIQALRRMIDQGKPFLGICLGLQLLFDESHELGHHRGLGVITGQVRRLRGRVKIPHMGWNQVKRKAKSEKRKTKGERRKTCPILKGIPDGAFFYFVHSYYGDPTDRSVIAAETRYGILFPCVLWRGNLFATQFHPEKSQALGLRLLDNFAHLS